MKKEIIPLILFTLLAVISCGNKDGSSRNCFFTRDLLLRGKDSSMFDFGDFRKEGLIEVSDKKSNIGAKGIYKFDLDQRLRFYAFLLSDSNDYVFSREYDVDGRIVNKTGGDVVQWYFRKLSEDSMKVTFYLYSLDERYDSIDLSYEKQTLKNIVLYTSPIYSNIVGTSVTLPNLNKQNGIIYIKGKKENKCIPRESTFVDSSSVPQL